MPQQNLGQSLGQAPIGGNYAAERLAGPALTLPQVGSEEQIVTNPANPSNYQYDWSQRNINEFLPETEQFVNPEGYANPLEFLSSQGIDVQGLDSSSMAFLPSMNPLINAFNRMNTGIGMARSGLGYSMDDSRLANQQNLLQMTGGQGIDFSGGFGRRASALGSGLRTSQQLHQDRLNQALGGFRSDVLSSQYDYQDQISQTQDALTTAIGNIMQSGEDSGINVSMVSEYDQNTAPEGYTGGRPANNTDYTDPNGNTWVFRNGSWQNVNDLAPDHYDDGY